MMKGGGKDVTRQRFPNGCGVKPNELKTCLNETGLRNSAKGTLWLTWDQVTGADPLRWQRLISKKKRPWRPIAIHKTHFSIFLSVFQSPVNKKTTAMSK